MMQPSIITTSHDEDPFSLEKGSFSCLKKYYFDQDGQLDKFIAHELYNKEDIDIFFLPLSSFSEMNKWNNSNIDLKKLEFIYKKITFSKNIKIRNNLKNWEKAYRKNYNNRILHLNNIDAPNQNYIIAEKNSNHSINSLSVLKSGLGVNYTISGKKFKPVALKGVINLSDFPDKYPIVVQDFIDPNIEIRLFIFNKNLEKEIEYLAIKTPSGKGESIDWRFDTYHSDQNYELYINNDMKKLAEKIIYSFNIEYLCVDIILTKDNRYYVIDVNPHGTWSFLSEKIKGTLTSMMSKLILN